MDIKLIKTRRVLSPTNMSLAPYCINPYRGCEFGCIYCYSQANKNIKRDEFFTRLGVKINAPDILKKELSLKAPSRVLLGSTTECFQYAENAYGITAKILMLLNENNIPYTILTKSHLIRQYLSLLAANPSNKIYFTFNTARDEVISLLEKKAPDVTERIATIQAIIDAGIPLRVHIGPFIPHLCNLKAILSALPAGVKEINVEVYHHSMGNFKSIQGRLGEKFGSQMKEKIASVYASENNYNSFAQELRKEISAIKTMKVIYIVPEFKEYYSGEIDYHDSV